METTHIVSSFDDELLELNQTVIRMGGMAEAGLASAIDALVRRDSELAERVVAGDEAIDELERSLEERAILIVARRQPLADDLRRVVAALKISSNLERIGDFAKNIAKRTITLNRLPPVPAAKGIPRLANLVQGIIKDILDAYIAGDCDKALDVWYRDAEVDEMHTGLFRELMTYMMEDPRNITPGTHLMFIAKNIERTGDYATNIAEMIYYLSTGDRIEGIEGDRPKSDSSSFQIVEAPGKSRQTGDGKNGGGKQVS